MDEEAVDDKLVELGRRWRVAVDAYLPTTAVFPAAGTAYGHDMARIGPVDSDLVPGVVASAKLMAAYDSARALSILWTARHVHLHADYALLRSVLENAGVAWWLLQSDASQDERLRRAYRVVGDDLRSALGRENLAERLAITLPIRVRHHREANAVKRRISEIERAMRMLGRGGLPEVKKWKRFEMLTEVLLPAQIHHRKLVPDLAFTWPWGMLSSLAHGSMTSMMGVSNVVEVDGQHVVHLNVDNLFMFARLTSRLLLSAAQGWYRYTGSSPLPGPGLTVGDDVLFDQA
ncbi:hypothetical protein [Curtobacterium sp. MCLR17_055]|uniref:hypothetical protein n=1 Tax=Curtobacterium sp. MCLR17_055 TaxID=2175633 RepID=UPI0011B66B06|nr:hypothetical protein [Curtobacterium sp. MCLR17_055]